MACRCQGLNILKATALRGRSPKLLTDNQEPCDPQGERGFLVNKATICHYSMLLTSVMRSFATSVTPALKTTPWKEAASLVLTLSVRIVPGQEALSPHRRSRSSLLPVLSARRSLRVAMGTIPLRFGLTRPRSIY